jgi:selenocysteine lyase/cysteine desulfurase
VLSGDGWWQELRAEFPYLDEHVFAWSGGQAPIARSVRTAIDRVLTGWQDDPVGMQAREWSVHDSVRAELATLMRCRADRIAVTESTSSALALATTMVLTRWHRAGAHPANVVLHWDCHPASSYHWLAASRSFPALTVRWADPADAGDPVAALLARADSDTIAVVATHVAWRSGAALDLGVLGERRASAPWAVLIDAAQSAGAADLGRYAGDLDFIAFPGYKWLLGPPGTGYLVLGPGWTGDASPVSGWAVAREFPVDLTEYIPMPGGAGIRYGMPDFLALAGSHAALQLVNRAGIDRIAGRIAELTGLLLTGLDNLGYDPVTPRVATARAGVCSVPVPDVPVAAMVLAEHRIATLPELNCIRLDLHAFNTEEDVARILDCFAAIRSRQEDHRG